MDKVKENIERYKVLAEIYLNEDRRIFIKDMDDTYYFCDILLVGETRIYVQCFAPEDKQGEKFEIPWPKIVKLEEYKGVKVWKGQ